MKWVAVARHGLILWENDATGSRKPPKSLRGPKYPIKNNKKQKHVEKSRKLIKLINYSPRSYRPLAVLFPKQLEL